MEAIISEIQFIDPPDNLSVIETRSFIANVKKFRDATDWQPLTDLEQGIDSTIVFFTKNKIL